MKLIELHKQAVQILERLQVIKALPESEYKAKEMERLINQHYVISRIINRHVIDGIHY